MTVRRLLWIVLGAAVLIALSAVAFTIAANYGFTYPVFWIRPSA